VKLWKVYVDNVEGCTGLKVLHLPTDDIKVYSTIDDPATALMENLSMCFAIYVAATVSLDESEVQVTLGRAKDALLLGLKVGLKQAFAQGDSPDRPTMTGLHALITCLVCFRS